MSGHPAVADGARIGGAPHRGTGTCLDPVSPFPDDVAGLSTLELHVWHSRIRLQLDQDTADPAGPHPLTWDRHLDLVAELAARGSWTAPAGEAP